MNVHMPGIPAKDEYAEWYAGYVSHVPEEDILAALAAQPDELDAILARVPEESTAFRYAPGKWSVREVVGHMIDAERVFGLRALCFSRGEEAALPGFDENRYVASSAYDAASCGELRREFRALRDANVLMFGRMNGESWTRRGTASGYTVSVRALAYITVGHPRHHLGILRERYLPGLGLAGLPKSEHVEQRFQ